MRQNPQLQPTHAIWAIHLPPNRNVTLLSALMGTGLTGPKLNTGSAVRGFMIRVPVIKNAAVDLSLRWACAFQSPSMQRFTAPQLERTVSIYRIGP